MQEGCQETTGETLFEELKSGKIEEARFYLQYQTITTFIGLFSVVCHVNEKLFWQAFVVQNGDFSPIVELLRDFRAMGVFKNQFSPIEIGRKELNLITDIMDYMVYDQEIEGQA